MYFVHPQIKLNKNNIWKIFKCFFKSPDFKKIEENLSLYFPEKHSIFTDMGRSAFRLIVEELNLRNSEIIMPSYICDVFYPILKQYNIQPIFVDIDLKTFNINPEDLRNKITEKTRAILVVHTYGLPADIEKIKEILAQVSSFPRCNGISMEAGKFPACQRLERRRVAGRQVSNVKIIEDCAHVFGAKHNSINSSQAQEKYLGNFSDASFFSIYKQFPSLRGGIAILPKNISKDLKKTYFSFRDLISFLNYFSFFSFLFKKFGSNIAPKFQRDEKSKQPALLNNVSLNLFSLFLENLEENIQKRIALAIFFQKQLKKMGFDVQKSKDNVFTFVSALVPEALTNKRDNLVKELKKYGIFCTRIWHTPIILNEQAKKEYNINLDEFPNTIEAAQRIINFPLQSWYTEKDIERIISAFKRIPFFKTSQSYSP